MIVSHRKNYMYLPHHHHFCLKAILWNRWKCSSILSHDLSWGEHVRSICSKARKILGLLYRRFYNNAPVLLYFNSTPPLLGPISIMPQPSGPPPYLYKDITKLENVQKFACRMATRLWDSSYQDLSSIVCASSVHAFNRYLHAHSTLLV